MKSAAHAGFARVPLPAGMLLLPRFYLLKFLSR